MGARPNARAVLTGFKKARITHPWLTGIGEGLLLAGAFFLFARPGLERSAYPFLAGACLLFGVLGGLTNTLLRPRFRQWVHPDDLPPVE